MFKCLLLGCLKVVGILGLKIKNQKSKLKFLQIIESKHLLQI